jgi:hypothetical protein
MKPTSLAFVWRLAKCGVLPLLLTTVLVAQQSVAPVAEPAGEPDACLRRSIPVTFIEKAKNASPLRPQDLQISVKGTTVSILSIAQDKHTPRVILLTDTSGSMGPPKGGPRWGIGLQIAEFAAAAISPEASVALGTFGEHLQVSEFQNRTSIVEQVLALRKIEPKGKTALYNALSSTSSLFKRPQFGDSIYLVTDGGDNHSSVDLRQLEDDLIARGVRVFVFLVSANTPYHTPEEREGPDNMADLARTTGGILISLQWSEEWFTKPEAASLAKSIRDQVESPYRARLQLTSPLSKPAKLSITLPHEPKAYTIVYPRRIEPCSKSAGE